jgi:hypothetical protein
MKFLTFCWSSTSSGLKNSVIWKEKVEWNDRDLNVMIGCDRSIAGIVGWISMKEKENEGIEMGFKENGGNKEICLEIVEIVS